MKKILIGLALTSVLLVATAKFWLPVLFVSAAKGSFSKDKLSVRSVTTSLTAINEYRKPIAASEGNKFVTIDMKLSLFLSDIDYYDFQLVKRNDYELGAEENVGDNLGDNYFNALPLNDDGTIATEWNTESNSFLMRITFEVPKTSIYGYLFYWGEYIGPLEFE